MKTTEQGIEAERAVAELLENEGYEIIGRNWKTRVCEIDVIAKKDRIIYFVEVKYRRQAAQGDGFEYITRQKLHKMNFAAEIWKQTYRWDGDYALMAAAVSGQNCQEIALTEV
jgi:uncharacterized protein (TIGR00252 family)